MSLQTSIFLERSNPVLQDRAEIVQLGNRSVFIVGDGAGGMSGGTEAADLFLCCAREAASGLDTAEKCGDLLRSIDRKISENPNCGETTGIICVSGPDGIFGSSVGDSACWFFGLDKRRELTMGQQRKPFLGSAGAWPCGFSQKPMQGVLVIATDGLWKYTSLELVEQKIQTAHVENLAARLGELVRLRSGTFPDDVAIATGRILC